MAESLIQDWDKVFIKDLVLDLSVGIYGHEKTKTQRVIVNAVFDVVSNQGRVLAGIGDVVSYELAVQTIRDIAGRHHYELLEQLAEDIAEKFRSDKRITAVTLALSKPDIIPGAAGVGVEIRRVFTA